MLAITITGVQVGQAIIATIIAVVGWLLKRQGSQIHVLVNARLTEALDRITLLETRLGLKPGEPVPPHDPD